MHDGKSVQHDKYDSYFFPVSSRLQLACFTSVLNSFVTRGTKKLIKSGDVRVS